MVMYILPVTDPAIELHGIMWILSNVMISLMYNTAKNAKTVFVHFSAVMLYEHWSLCIHYQIGHYKYWKIINNIKGKRSTRERVPTIPKL